MSILKVADKVKTLGPACIAVAAQTGDHEAMLYVVIDRVYIKNLDIPSLIVSWMILSPLCKEQKIWRY